MIAASNGLKLPETLAVEGRPEMELYRTGTRDDAEEIQVLIERNWTHLHDFSYVGEAEPTVSAVLDATIETILAMTRGEEAQFLVAQRDKIIGRVGLTGIDVGAGVAKLSYWLGQEFQYQGFATAAARRMVQFGFEEANLKSVWAMINRQNAGSERVAQAIGARLTDVVETETNKGRTIEYRRWEIDRP